MRFNIIHDAKNPSRSQLLSALGNALKLNCTVGDRCDVVFMTEVINGSDAQEQIALNMSGLARAPAPNVSKVVIYGSAMDPRNPERRCARMVLPVEIHDYSPEEQDGGYLDFPNLP